MSRINKGTRFGIDKREFHRMPGPGINKAQRRTIKTFEIPFVANLHHGQQHECDIAASRCQDVLVPIRARLILAPL